MHHTAKECECAMSWSEVYGRKTPYARISPGGETLGCGGRGLEREGRVDAFAFRSIEARRTFGGEHVVQRVLL